MAEPAALPRSRAPGVPRELGHRLRHAPYVMARLARRFLVPDRLLALAPGYAVSRNETDPAPIVDQYLDYAARGGPDLAGLRVLEIGVGATNSTGYELAARTGIRSWRGYEPYSRLNHALDGRMLRRIAHRYHADAADLRKRATRVTRIDDPASGSVDLILSHCVLEHVRQPRELLRSLAGMLTPGGRMIHAVDYRDHFFQYPFSFLTFSETVWRRFLDPGDLPRFRLMDHVDLCRAAGLGVEILEKRLDPEQFSQVAPWVRPAFRRGIPEDAAVWAVLAMTCHASREGRTD